MKLGTALRPFALTVLALTWFFLGERLQPISLLTGYLVAVLILTVLASPVVRLGRVRARGAWSGVRLLVYFAWELVKANVTVAWLVVQPRPRLKPGIIAYPLRVTTAAQIALLSNLLTLTPGTLTVDVSKDQSVLYIHCLDATDEQEAMRPIRRFEDLILEVIAA